MNWKILGPNSQEALPPQNRDIEDPVSGSFYFGEGEGGVRIITLTVCPHENFEVEEIFIIKLELVKGEAKLDSRSKDITITVSPTLFFPQNFGFNEFIRKCILYLLKLHGLMMYKTS